jgi:ABC-type dipeptide/oligopeptide/nickel transport system permease subunit
LLYAGQISLTVAFFVTVVYIIIGVLGGSF